MTIVKTRAITGGVDTHADVHVAAALDPIGGLLGVREFPATPEGYGRLLGWLGGFGTVSLVGIEGTGSYGAGLARHITWAGVRVVEAGRSDPQAYLTLHRERPFPVLSALQPRLTAINYYSHSRKEPKKRLFEPLTEHRSIVLGVKRNYGSWDRITVRDGHRAGLPRPSTRDAPTWAPDSTPL